MVSEEKHSTTIIEGTVRWGPVFSPENTVTRKRVQGRSVMLAEVRIRPVKHYGEHDSSPPPLRLTRWRRKDPWA